MKHGDERRTKKREVGLYCVIALLLTASLFSFTFPEGWANEYAVLLPPDIIRAAGVVQLGFGVLLSAEVISRYAQLKRTYVASRALGAVLLIAGIGYILASSLMGFASSLIDL